MLLGANLQKVQDRQAYQDYSWSYNNGWDRGGAYWNNTRARQQVGARERMRGANLAKEVMREVESKTGQVRQSMTRKYNIQF